MKCNTIIEDTEISENYIINQIDKVKFVKSKCLSIDVKECEMDIFDKSGKYITYTPIQRKYHNKFKLRAFEGVGKVAEHKLFVLNEEFRGNGIATDISKNEEIIYKRNFFNEVHIDAAWDGVNVWRRLGFLYVNESDKNKLLIAWRAYFMKIWQGKDKLDIIRKYKIIDDVPIKYLKPKNLDSMGDWLLNSQTLPIIKMYKRIA